jgi:phosphatidylinositol alpha 1,6-mannosyltransferase
VPVVAPAAGGPLDLIRTGDNGLLFAPDDGTALRAAVASLVGDEGRRAQMGIAARRSVRGRTWQAICDELLGHYEEVAFGAVARRAA